MMQTCLFAIRSMGRSACLSRAYAIDPLLSLKVLIGLVVPKTRKQPSRTTAPFQFAEKRNAKRLIFLPPQKKRQPYRFSMKHKYHGISIQRDKAVMAS